VGLSVHDVAVVGAGLVGLATARALAASGRSVVVLEAEPAVAEHQSGHNSGVIHAGLYYRPGSLKARLCVEGRERLYAFCRERGIACEQCGKVVVATTAAEVQRLGELEQRGLANGLAGLTRLTPQQIREHEPHASGLAGLFVPQTGVVDFAGVARAIAAELPDVRTGHRVLSARVDGDAVTVETSRGTVRALALVTCAGLQADRVARACGHEPRCRIVPVRGEFWRLRAAAEHLVRHLIYPVPDPSLPFLGVHLTRRVTGVVEAGPNAVLALNRHGYRRGRPRAADAVELLTWSGAWRMAARHWRTGVVQAGRSLSRRASARALRALVPELEPGDLVAGPRGVRAMAVDPDGTLVDDFRIERSVRAVHVLNAPSPAATACLAIGRYVAEQMP